MKSSIIKEIANEKWILAGINLDEDIHFSTYYLRMSFNENIKHIFNGYSKCVAIYENFNEKYYLLERECEQLSKTLIFKIADNKDWFINILNNIVIYSNKINNLFDYNTLTKYTLSNMTNEEICNLYQKQYNESLEMYLYARIPEMLDRGNNYFSNYLTDYLRQILRKDNVNTEFVILTSANDFSIYQKAENELEEIKELLLKNKSVNNIRNRKLFADKNNRDVINNYISNWRWLDYHGYGTRKLMTIDDVIAQAIKLSDIKDVYNINKNIQLKEALYKELNIDSRMKGLFEIYPRLSITKLHRKYYQIKNFYYLDMMIDEIANRVNESCAFVRCMLPEEIIDFFQSRNIEKRKISERIESCIYFYPLVSKIKPPTTRIPSCPVMAAV